MTSVIFRKELLDLHSGWRLVIFTAMLALLGLVVVVTRSVDHEKALQDYSDIESLKSEALDGGLTTQFWGGLMFQPFRRPARMSPIAQGTQQSTMERLSPPIYEDPIAVLYPPADLLLVMGIVISLGALMLSSDLICGERETGTIRLMTANSVKRSSILLGKWLACLAALGAGILLLFVVVALSLALMRPDAWTVTDWVSYVVLFVFSLVYASAFLMIGMFLSAVTRQAGTAAVLALMVWAVVVFVMPSLPVYVARETYTAISPTYAMISGLRAEDERKAAIMKLKAPLRARGLAEVDVEQQIDKKAVEKIMSEEREKKKSFNASFDRSIIQGFITAAIAQTSPYASYVIGGTEITGVGFASMASFLFYSQGQETVLNEYTQKKFDAWKQAVKSNPNLPKSPVLDMRDRPKGTYRGDPLVFRMGGAGPSFLFLSLFNILFFVLAWRSFLRYDVR